MESDLLVDHPSSYVNQWQEETWFFQITVPLYHGADFSDILNASKQQLEHSLSSVLVISWAACQESESEHFGSQSVKCFVQDCSSNRI